MAANIQWDTATREGVDPATGADYTSVVRMLLNEVQVLLHQHPLNAARQTRGLPPVNSVWFWGAGRLPAPGPSPTAAWRARA